MSVTYAYRFIHNVEVSDLHFLLCRQRHYYHMLASKYTHIALTWGQYVNEQIQYNPNTSQCWMYGKSMTESDTHVVMTSGSNCTGNPFQRFYSSDILPPNPNQNHALFMIQCCLTPTTSHLYLRWTQLRWFDLHPLSISACLDSNEIKAFSCNAIKV